MEEAALSRRSSTLPPPPLANGAAATRALQRFDLGRMRSMGRLAPATPATPAEPIEPTEPTQPLVRTARMSVPTSIKGLALVSTARLAVPPSIKLLDEPAAPALAAGVVDAKRVGHRALPFHAAAWAFAASASLVGAGSLVTVLVYTLLFP